MEDNVQFTIVDEHPWLIVHTAAEGVCMNHLLRDDDVTKIYCVWDEDMLSIVHLYVPETRWGRGIGSRLLGEACVRATHMGGRTMTVDDMTDRAHRESNIYLKHGFMYKSSTHPEMVLPL